MYYEHIHLLCKYAKKGRYTLSIIEKMQDPEILLTLPVGEKLYGSIIVMVLGMVCCMVILTIILFMVKLMHYIMSRGEVKAKKAAEAAAGEIDPATAAAIVSAVSEMEGGKPFKVRSIHQVEGGGK